MEVELSLHSATLRYFVKVAEHGSIRRAAETLNIASSAVNRKILNLERSLGVALFKRTPHGVTPTSAGMLLLRHARETLSDFQRTIDQMDSQTGEIKGTVRITGIGSIIDCALPEALMGLSKKHEGIVLQVLNANPDDVVDGLRIGRADIGITFLDNRHRDFEVCARLNTTFGALMTSDHPLARRRSVTLTECASYDTSMFADRWTIRPLVDTEFHETGAEFRARVITNSMTVMRTAILQGVGIGFFTPIAFIEEIKRGQISFVPLHRSELVPTHIGLLTSKAALGAPAVRVLIDHLSDLFWDLQRSLDETRTE